MKFRHTTINPVYAVDVRHINFKHILNDRAFSVTQRARSVETDSQILRNMTASTSSDDNPTRSFDIIIVGGGTAGCVLASRLSSISHLNILLLEAGPDNNADPKVSTPLTSRRMFKDPNYDWNFQTVPQVGLNGRVIEHTRGRMIGGSSAINSHSLVYPNRAMHDAWAEIAGDQRWSWDRMEPFYKTFQTVQVPDVPGESVSTAQPDSSGPIQASYPRNMNILQSAWQDVFRSLDAFSDRDGMSGRAVGGVTTTNAIDARAMRGERSHAGNSFLEPAIGRSNLTVETGAIVKKVDFREGNSGGIGSLQAVGVTYEKGGITLSVRARNEVILCAGAFGSPQILELSGIGDKGVLENASVQCLLDLPGVGGENPKSSLSEICLTRILRESPGPPQLWTKR